MFTIPRDVGDRVNELRQIVTQIESMAQSAIASVPSPQEPQATQPYIDKVKSAIAKLKEFAKGTETGTIHPRPPKRRPDLPKVRRTDILG